MTLAHVAKLNDGRAFRAVISQNEVLHITGSKVSILSARSGLCNVSYFIHCPPRLLSTSPYDTSRLALVFPASGCDPESVVVLETRTGKTQKQFSLKNTSQSFQCIAIGMRLFFVVDTNPQTVYFCSFSSEQRNVRQVDFGSRVTCLRANESEEEFLVVCEDKRLMIVGEFTANGGSKIMTKIPGFQPFMFIHFRGQEVVYGDMAGSATWLSSETGQVVKTVTSPRASRIVDCSGSYAVSRDGLIFDMEGNVSDTYVFQAKAIVACGVTVIVLYEQGYEVFERHQMPVCTASTLEPVEPFVAMRFSVEVSILFAAAHSLYGFSLVGHDVSKFASIQERVLKVVTGGACVSVVCAAADCKRITTFVTGSKKRDEIGIDVMCDRCDHTWILEKDAVIEYERMDLELEESSRHTLEKGHSYTQIVRLGQTVGVYANDGQCAYLNKQGVFVPFRMPRDLTIIQWPALCTRDSVFICTSENQEYEKIDVRSDYVILTMSVSSCCWLGRTLFAVEGSIVVAIGQKTGKKRVVDKLPNACCALAMALPCQLVFITMIPDLRVVLLRGPFLSSYVLSDLCSHDIEAFKFMLDYMPRIAPDPKSFVGSAPLIAMSVFVRDSPKYVDDFVIQTYARFAKFDELRKLAGQDREIRRKIAKAAANIGQFGVAQEIYDEINDFESLFEMFVLLKDKANLSILASRSPLAPLIKQAFLADPVDGRYTPVANLPLPQIRSPITSNSQFALVIGDRSDGTELASTGFDGLDDFGMKEFVVSEDSQSHAMSTGTMTDISSAHVDTSSAPVPEEEIQYKERPVESPPADEAEASAGLAAFFGDDDEDETAKPAKISIEFKMKGPRGGRGRASKCSLDLNGDSSDGRRRSTAVSGRRSAFKLNDGLPDTSSNGLDGLDSPVASNDTVPIVRDPDDVVADQSSDVYQSTMFLD